jgi:hypothetical protein
MKPIEEIYPELNAAYCEAFKRIFVSTTTQDYAGCEESFIDGGLSYVRGGGLLTS